MRAVLLFMLIGIAVPSPSWAWYAYDWNWHGSGRDHPYSEYINRYYAHADFYDDGIFINGQPYNAANINPSAVALTPMDEVQYVGLPDMPDQMTVNIPNDHGGYTPVVIKRTANGFIGPQGEFYPQFPKVSQLKVMYGK